MSEATITQILNAINSITFICYLVLLGVILATLLRRVALYRKSTDPIPVLLKRDLGLFIAFSVVFGEILLIRTLDISLFSEPGVWRLAFVVQQNAIVLIALAYWAKVELADL